MNKLFLTVMLTLSAFLSSIGAAVAGSGNDWYKTDDNRSQEEKDFDAKMHPVNPEATPTPTPAPTPEPSPVPKATPSLPLIPITVTPEEKARMIALANKFGLAPVGVGGTSEGRMFLFISPMPELATQSVAIQVPVDVTDAEMPTILRTARNAAQTEETVIKEQLGKMQQQQGMKEQRPLTPKGSMWI